MAILCTLCSVFTLNPKPMCDPAHFFSTKRSLNWRSIHILYSVQGSIPYIGIDIRPPVVRQCSPISGKVPNIRFGATFWERVGECLDLNTVEGELMNMWCEDGGQLKLFWKCYGHLGWRRKFLVFCALSLMCRRLKSSMPSSKKSNHLRYGELKVL